MRDENVKSLFSDLYVHQLYIKEGIKDAAKLSTEILYKPDWESLSAVINELYNEVSLIEKHAAGMRVLLETFVSSGMYEGQAIGKTPMEGLAEDN